ncbi:MAG: hypothetical protein IJX86_04425 [Lachnospiraceae bacterium]|nr:hypothetical protein [Lachnospiraceae bacterium]MBR3683395.1 hypothetical protein [Lachnospiraceae bacterium]
MDIDLQEKPNLRVCKKCLLRDFDEKAYFDKLHKYIEVLDESVRTPKELYEKRLETCKNCDKLSEGTCIGCGCYVELRAAVKKNRCPYKHW